MNGPTIWRRLAAWVLLVVLLSSGCAPTPPVGQVTGKVRFRGGVLPTGTVTFLCADSRSVSARIATDGTYRMDGVAAGPARISVISHPRVPPGFRKAPVIPGEPAQPAVAPEPPPVAIPVRYGKPETSGLTYDVQKGVQTHDLDLQP